MTRQEMFDKALFGVLGQGGPAMIGTVCAYYTSEGRRCALGHLGTEEQAKEWENVAAGCGFDSLKRRVHMPTPILANEGLVNDLQNAHDGSADMCDWKYTFIDCMEGVAEKHNLTFPNLE